MNGRKVKRNSQQVQEKVGKEIQIEKNSSPNEVSSSVMGFFLTWILLNKKKKFLGFTLQS
jgi:hypothetical protein